MQTLHQLFVHELQDTWAAEQQVADALDRLSRETTPQVQQLLQTHLQETRTHIARLRQVFDALGVEPSTITCEGMEGIIREHDRFTAENRPSPQVHAVFAIGAGERVEHYEIAAYDELIRLANALGYRQVIGYLQADLAEEREQLRRLQSAAQTTGMELAAQQGAQQQQVAPGQGQQQTVLQQ